jgi:hypothetical protein
VTDSREYLLYHYENRGSTKLGENIIDMKYKPKIQNIIRMLIKNRFYFDLPLLERYELIQGILRRFPSSMQRPLSFQEKDLFARRER